MSLLTPCASTHFICLNAVFQQMRMYFYRLFILYMKVIILKTIFTFSPLKCCNCEFENSIKSIQLIKDEWQDGKGSPKQLTKEQEEQPPASQTAPSAWPDPDPNYCNSRRARRDKCELQKMPPVPRQREIQPTDLPNTRTWYLYFRHS